MFALRVSGGILPQPTWVLGRRAAGRRLVRYAAPVVWGWTEAVFRSVQQAALGRAAQRFWAAGEL